MPYPLRSLLYRKQLLKHQNEQPDAPRHKIYRIAVIFPPQVGHEKYSLRYRPIYGKNQKPLCILRPVTHEHAENQ